MLARAGVKVTVLEAERDDRRRHAHERTDAPRPAARRLLGRPRDGGRRAVAERARARAPRPAVVLARGRPRAPARRRRRRRDAALDRRHRARARRGRARRGERVFGSPSRGFDALSEDIMRPILHVPRHPLRLARFGLPAAMPATLIAAQVQDRGGAGAVGRLRRARLQPAVAADELVGRDGADLRRAPLRLAGRARRLARDQRRAGRGRARARRQRSRPGGA